MCRGVQENNQVNCCRKLDGVSPNTNSGLISCELCGLRASLYCQADDAFLCYKCDRYVHCANKIVLRHFRCFLCNTCQNFTRRYLLGARFVVKLPAVVSLRSRRHCDSNVEEECSSPGMPFKFL